LSSVFPAPIRPVLAAKSYAEACQIGENTDGRKISRQTWAIVPKILELDACLRVHPTFQRRIREVHPELCFYAWNNNRAMDTSKKTTARRDERKALVNPRFGNEYRAAQCDLRQDQYDEDDLLDAFAALWTAERMVAGAATVLPADPPLDSCGLRMEMVV
jgi:predicted RNase H-like nuclease